MTEHAFWPFSRALQFAVNDGQFEDLEALIDEHVDWAIYGPIELFPFLGMHRGKAAVIEVIRQISALARIRHLIGEAMMLGPNSASSMMRISLEPRGSSKRVTFRVAHFVQFRDGKLVRLRMLLDSLDLMTQTLVLPTRLLGLVDTPLARTMTKRADAQDV